MQVGSEIKYYGKHFERINGETKASIVPKSGTVIQIFTEPGLNNGNAPITYYIVRYADIDIAVEIIQEKDIIRNNAPTAQRRNRKSRRNRKTRRTRR
jgi:hypothetical protein